MPDATGVLHVAGGALLPFLCLRDAVCLRTTCTSGRAAVSEHPWCEITKHGLDAPHAHKWVACFPHARALFVLCQRVWRNGSWGDADWRNTTFAAPRVTTLRIDGGRHGYHNLATMLAGMPHLAVLDAHNNELSEVGAYALSLALQHTPCLSVLNLVGNYMHAGGVRQLASAMRHVGGLTVLKLGRNDIAEGVGDLSAALVHTPHLVELDLHLNRIHDDDFHALAPALAYVPQLRVLRLDHNGLRDEGMRAIARALPCVPRLHTLDVSDNSIADVGYAELALALAHVRDLQMLDVSAMWPSQYASTVSPGRAMLQHAVAGNTRITLVL